MYRQFGNTSYHNGFAELGHNSLTVAQSGQLDALVALERIGTRLVFTRNDEIYAEGDSAKCWYKVVSGTVRICKLLIDGRRHIGEFCFSGDCFGLDGIGERPYSAEAVDDVIVMRFQRKATERLIDQNLAPGPPAARCNVTRSGQCARTHVAAGPHDRTRAGGRLPSRDVRAARPDKGSRPADVAQ